MHSLLRLTLDIPPHVRFNARSLEDRSLATLTLRRGGGDGPATTVKVADGPATYLAIRQTLYAAHGNSDTHRLRTIGYRYALTPDEDPRSDAFVRWEFDRDVHHIQVGATVGGYDLNRLHLPTGWVPLERVLRFLVDELGVTPRCDRQTFDTALRKSERQFFDEFADTEDLLGLLGHAPER